MGTAHEKRRAPRTRHNSVLEIYDQEGHFISGVGRLVDVSSVGACFSTTRRLKKGEKLRALLRLLKEGVLEVSARVVWSRKKPNTILYGIEFETVKKIKRN